ncbi:nucleoside hydrolase [Thermobifida fusca]|uniref:Inosine-uridine preferring nucleoside hydrolase n=2 Tax=Thermobifida fusca TaxID=2021 RepID=A0A9P2T9N4_THEFU|nr:MULTISPECIES: nucleoside hydrolase [Thermobifida]AAZ56614.1 inosine-uridine preferring nucleoside hydrolase [Thermobifida fusca YX]EOR70315.1 inosine-uridine preferring nucleoside hydrolase [Thermobifida fusca TM51]MBO2528468.1 nucleoside hydrolase [Thermobifida sp.]PPS93317.1 nucleoside hydrolase [Thermobifida fusca]PZN63675.1 MAG: nucleoside hydrolase [Thermobifida fusca]
MRVFVDCDPGIDDALALAYLAADHRVEIAGVGAVYGNTGVESTAENAVRLLQLFGRPETPVAVGAARPLMQQPRLARHVHGDNGLGGIELPEAAKRPVSESAAELLVRLARSAPGELNVLALGPLTNLAVALALEPRLPELVNRVVVMGGAVRSPGNVTPWAEANVNNDPEAAEAVLGAGFDLTLVALDVTMRALATESWLEELAALPGERAQYAHRFLAYYVGWYTSFLGQRACPMHDPLAAAVLVDPSLVKESETVPVLVELAGAHTRGMTIADLRPRREETSRPAVVLPTEVDVPKFLSRMLRALA